MFAKTLGQAKAVSLLTKALQNDRLAHAYLLTGPEGVGKSTTARQFAAALLCSTGGDERPCGTCSTCIQYTSGNNPDFLHILPQGATIKIDQVRDLKKSLGYPPLESPYRVVLLDQVHTMRREAGNSLLKLLEEPPPDNILLLTAVDSEPILPTIVSRCQVIPFYPLPTDLATRILQEKMELSEEDAHRLAQLTNGCPGLAQTLDTEKLLPVYDAILAALLQTDQEEAARVESALALAADAAELKDGLEQLLDLLRLFFKQAMAACLTQNTPSTTETVILRARERWNLTQLSDMVQAVDFVARTLARNCNRQLACEALFLQLLNT